MDNLPSSVTTVTSTSLIDAATSGMKSPREFQVIEYPADKVQLIRKIKLNHKQITTNGQ